MGGLFDTEHLKEKLEDLKKQTLTPNFYDDIKNSTEVNMQISSIEKELNDYYELLTKINVSLELPDLVEEKDLQEISKALSVLELNTYLSGEYDNLNCYLEIHSGAGGTEACDWCQMLCRMYERFFEKNNYKYQIIDVQNGEEAGYKSVFMEVSGPHAFGYLKKEGGVHRLVRISPFDASKRRHTSFASVNVTPVFNKECHIDINEKDLKIDVFHSSGAGGQSVNTSNSAVRITHLPTKIVVSVQNERSQLKNKEIAMNILQSKLYALELAKQEEKVGEFKLNDSINFGSQIRSYILEPYKLVKDNRSDFTSNEPDKILDGQILPMLEFNLKNIK